LFIEAHPFIEWIEMSRCGSISSIARTIARVSGSLFGRAPLRRPACIAGLKFFAAKLRLTSMRLALKRERFA
jgi:hypothetical protein